MTPATLSQTMQRECRHASARRSERRTISGQVETRSLTEAEKSSGYIGVLIGRIPLNTDSVELRDRRLNGGQPFVERIAPKAFDELDDVIAVVGHTDDPLAAVARSGANLSVVETATEIRWEALLPDTQAGRDLAKLGPQLDEKGKVVRAGIIRGTSFEFGVGAKDKWEKRADGTAVRTVIKGKLSRFNPVLNPAYDESELSVSMRGRRGDEESEERGCYYSADGIVCYYDPTMTPDAKFAGNALSRATYALTDALEYLRAVPAGALADYANAEVAAAATNAKTLIDWLATNGTAVNPAALKRATEALAEARAADKPQPLSQTDHDRERRFRILQLGSR